MKRRSFLKSLGLVPAFSYVDLEVFLSNPVQESNRHGACACDKCVNGDLTTLSFTCPHCHRILMAPLECFDKRGKVLKDELRCIYVPGFIPIDWVKSPYMTNPAALSRRTFDCGKPIRKGTVVDYGLFYWAAPKMPAGMIRTVEYRTYPHKILS